MNLTPGTPYGSFQIIARIGRGLTGPVYRAVYKDGTPTALKFIDARDESVRAYFLNEVTLLRQALPRAHPHLARYVASNTGQQPFYLATRFVDGGRELTELLRRPCPPGFALRVAEQIAGALDYLHYGHPNAPVIHRDVKPANILLDATGDALLIDLSAACYPGFSLAGERGLGTPRYMPSEQYLGDERPQSDQFALAMLVYQLLAGKPALPVRTAAAKRGLEKLRSSDHRAMRAALRHMPAATRVLVRATAYDWSGRYATCAEFVWELRRALRSDGVPLTDEAPPAVPRALPWGWMAMGLLGALALLLLVVI